LSLIFLSVDGVILYGELLLKKVAIYGGKKLVSNHTKKYSILVNQYKCIIIKRHFESA
jgi:hypothetical protein